MFIEFEDIHGHRVAFNPNNIARFSEGGDYTYIETIGEGIGEGANVKGSFDDVLEILNNGGNK